MTKKSKKRRQVRIRQTWGDLSPVTQVTPDRRKDLLEDEIEKQPQEEMEDYNYGSDEEFGM